jgi:hypothetical protein
MSAKAANNAGKGRAFLRRQRVTYFTQHNQDAERVIFASLYLRVDRPERTTQ